MTEKTFLAFHNNYEQISTIFIFYWTYRKANKTLVNMMEKVVVTSLNDPAKYLTELTERSKKGHHIIYQKRIIEAKQSE